MHKIPFETMYLNNIKLESVGKFENYSGGHISFQPYFFSSFDSQVLIKKGR